MMIKSYLFARKSFALVSNMELTWKADLRWEDTSILFKSVALTKENTFLFLTSGELKNKNLNFMKK